MTTVVDVKTARYLSAATSGSAARCEAGLSPAGKLVKEYWGEAHLNF